MKDKEYIQSLENLLIFMCQTYEEQHEAVLVLAKEGNKEPLLKIPRIQGSHQLSGIRHLSQLEFVKPNHSFKDVVEKIKNTEK